MRVLIVDDHPLFRQGLRALLSALDAELAACDVNNVDEARGVHASGFAPELVLLDMNLPGTSGTAAIADIKAMYESACVVVVSGDEDPTLIRSAIDAGAAGYIPKTTDPELTIQALRLVLANGVYLPAAALAGSTLASQSARPGRQASGPDLSPRQRAVLRCLLQGKSNKVIARELSMAEGTVKAHLWAVYQVMHVSSRTHAMYRAHELGLFEDLCD